MLRKVMREVVAAACGQVVLHAARTCCQLHGLGALGRVAAQQLGRARGLAGLRSQVDGVVLHAWWLLVMSILLHHGVMHALNACAHMSHNQTCHCTYDANS